jgi:hypothetical protein
VIPLKKIEPLKATAIDIWSRGRLAHLIDNAIMNFMHIFIDELREY